MFRIAHFLLLAVALVALTSSTSLGVLVDAGDVTIIDDAGNPSDGLRYLDMSFSDGKTLATALVDAQVIYSDVRLATPAEFVDLLAASGITYDVPLVTVLAGFDTGASILLSSGSNFSNGILGTPDRGSLLQSFLGSTVGGPITNLWTAPDNDSLDSSFRDIITINGSVSPSGRALATGQLSNGDSDFADQGVGWLLVTSVPEPSAFLFFCSASVGALGMSRRRILR